MKIIDLNKEKKKDVYAVMNEILTKQIQQEKDPEIKKELEKSRNIVKNKTK